MAGGYSNRVRATKFNPTGMNRKRANIQMKDYFIPELNKTVKIAVTPRGMRTITKNGVYKSLKKAKVI